VLGDNITNETFEKVKNELKSQRAMKSVITYNKPEDLYNKAVSGKGQNIWGEYSNQLTKHKQFKNTIIDNNNVVNKNMEVNNDSKMIKQGPF
jgi:hypothetical protein